MEHKIQLTEIVTSETAGMRLDQALALMFPDYSRSRLQSWIKAGHVVVNGKALRQRDLVVGGETIEINATLEPQGKCVAENIPLDIVYEDSSILVINKPAGLVVHPAAGHPNGTLQNALLHHAPELIEVPRSAWATDSNWYSHLPSEVQRTASVALSPALRVCKVTLSATMKTE